MDSSWILATVGRELLQLNGKTAKVRECPGTFCFFKRSPDVLLTMFFKVLH